MNNLEYKTFFDDKISNMPPDDISESLDYPHMFLKMALSYVPECSDPVIGHYEMDNSGIKYDGYFIDEDEQEFHIVFLVYFNEPTQLDEEDIRESIFKATIGATNLLKRVLNGKSNISTENEIGEHIQEMIDEKNNGYSFSFDCFSNVDLSSEWFNPSINVGRADYQIEYHDANQIVETIKADEMKDLVVDFKGKHGVSLQAIKVAENNDFDVYLTSITGDVLSSVYKDNKSRLMDGNVRAFLKRTQKTNRGILQTIKDAPENFVAYNNGISAVASAEGSKIIEGKDGMFFIESLCKMQIVNGGQTTITIYESANDPLDLSKVTVPLKLTVLKCESDQAGLVSNIAVYANTQTAISKSDLASNKPFYKTLEALSRTSICFGSSAHSANTGHYWFFERANGLYNTRKRIIWNSSNTFTRQFPESCKFSKKAMAKSIMAFSQMPFYVCLGNENCFQYFNNAIDQNEVLPGSLYFRRAVATLILWKTADKIIRDSKLPIKAAVLPYTIAYLAFKTDSRLNLDKIWDSQSLDEETKVAVDGVSKAISAYFVSVQAEQPNTLMWGRKKECWTAIKSLDIDFGDLPTPCYQQITFFPKNPAAEFIDDPFYFNSAKVWIKLLAWNETAKILSAKDVETVNNIIAEITVSSKVSMKNEISAGRAAFMKAAMSGYCFK